MYSVRDSQRKFNSLELDYSSKRGYNEDDSEQQASNIMSMKNYKEKMQKLAEVEKKQKEKRLYQEDHNRSFVIEKSINFLTEVANEETKSVPEKVSSSDESYFEPKKAKPTKVFIVDQGRSPEQTQTEWEQNIMERGFKDAQRVYMTPGNNLHPFAVMSYLPYGCAKTVIATESSTSSNQTFSSSNTSKSDMEDQDSSYTDSSSSSSKSRRDSFEQAIDAPKCHRGHIHKQWATSTNYNHHDFGDDNANLYRRCLFQSDEE